MSITAFYHAPKHEIEQSLEWLYSIKEDCEYKISRLEAIKRQHDQSNQNKLNIKKMALEFAREDFLDIDEQNQLKIIQQRYGLSVSRASDVLEVVLILGKRKKKEIRDIKIARLHDAGEKPAHIARAIGVSRPTVYDAIKRHDKNPLY